MQMQKADTLSLSVKRNTSMGKEIEKWQMYELNKLLSHINNKPNISFSLYI